MNHPSETNSYSHHYDLKELISSLMKTIVPRAMDSRSCFINEIPAKLDIRTDMQLVSTVLDGILSFVVKHARESYIRLSAKVYGHIVLVNISKQGLFNNNASIQQDVSRLQAMAEKMLGSVNITSEGKDISTLTFGFPNLPPFE